jgi:hypothetical protein
MMPAADTPHRALFELVPAAIRAINRGSRRSHVATELLADRLPGLLFPATRSKNYNIVMCALICDRDACQLHTRVVAICRYNLRLKKGSGKLAPAGAPCDASGRYYDADDVDPAKPIAVFWHLIDQGMVHFGQPGFCHLLLYFAAECRVSRLEQLKSRGKKGQGVVDPLTMIEKRGFQTHAWRLDSGVWQVLSWVSPCSLQLGRRAPLRYAWT